MTSSFWEKRRVFITGHTGFKGSWLSLWLHRMGAEVSGYSLGPPTHPSLFDLAGLSHQIVSVEGDVQDPGHLQAAMRESEPEIVFHLAAQPLVRASYEEPVETYATNVMGTIHLLEAVRSLDSVKAVVVVTSDKCYDNREWDRSYAETDAMGGADPYSSSKACAELVTAAWRRSFFGRSGSPAVATVRAGNVIGGGDWARDRLVPDLIAAFAEGRPARIRNPRSVRPWQHVIEPLGAYLMLAEKMATGEKGLDEAWNFGPEERDCVAVGQVTDTLARLWGGEAGWEEASASSPQPHEAGLLKLDCSKARTRLGWSPTIGLDTALQWTAAWYASWRAGLPARDLVERDLANFEKLRASPSIAGAAADRAIPRPTA